MESYLNAIKLEVKARNHLISLLTQADTQLSNDKKDVKLVANVRNLVHLYFFFPCINQSEF